MNELALGQPRPAGSSSVPARLRLKKFVFRPPEMFVVGSEEDFRRIKQGLAGYNVALRLAESEEDVLDRAGGDTVAVMIATPEHDMTDAVHLLSHQFEATGMLIIAVVHNESSSAPAKALYEQGADVVMGWPKKEEFLGKMLFELMRAKRKDRSKPMSRYLNIKLKLLARTLHVFRVTVKDGVAHVVGRVESFQQKVRLKKIIEATPGIRKVHLSAVHVPEGERADEELLSQVLRKIKRSPAIREETLSFSVEDRKVQVEGTAADRSEVGQVMKCLSSIEGVREVENKMRVSLAKKRKDAALAREINQHLSGLFFESEVKATVLDQTAVLRGRVNMKRKCRIAEEAISDIPGVTAIKNLIVIGEPVPTKRIHQDG